MFFIAVQVVYLVIIGLITYKHIQVREKLAKQLKLGYDMRHEIMELRMLVDEYKTEFNSREYQEWKNRKVVSSDEMKKAIFDVSGDE